MKAVLQALYLLTTALGNLIDIIVVSALSSLFNSQASLCCDSRHQWRRQSDNPTDFLTLSLCRPTNSSCSPGWCLWTCLAWCCWLGATPTSTTRRTKEAITSCRPRRPGGSPSLTASAVEKGPSSTRPPINRSTNGPITSASKICIVHLIYRQSRWNVRRRRNGTCEVYCALHIHCSLWLVCLGVPSCNFCSTYVCCVLRKLQELEQQRLQYIPITSKD